LKASTASHISQFLMNLFSQPSEGQNSELPDKSIQKKAAAEKEIEYACARV